MRRAQKRRGVCEIGSKFEDEPVFVAGPSSRVGQVEEGAVPIGEGCSAEDIGFDRADDGDDVVRLEAGNGACKGGFGGDAGGAAVGGGELIDRLRTEVDQVAAGRLKSGKEIGVVDGGIDGLEGFADGAIEAGVAIIEEFSGSGGRFADEEELIAGRSKAAPPALP